MSQSSANSDREARLAAKLRENLRRRKAQARAIDADGSETIADSQCEPLPKSGGKS